MRHSTSSIWLVTGMLSTLVCVSAAPDAYGASCVVLNTLDASAVGPPAPDSLRDCLTRVGSGDTITFDTSVFDLTNSDAATTIGVGSELPPLAAGNVTIDAKDRRVTINGSGAGSARGLVISSDGNRVGGLTITGFASGGIHVSGADNRIGGSRGVGTGPNGQGLRISGNGAFGIEISGPGATGNVVKGCWIGLDADGATPQANGVGIVIADGATGTEVGGDPVGEPNVIAHNGGNGVEVRATSSRKNGLRANRITRNKSRGIALFDNANDGIAPPRIDSIQELGPNGAGTGVTYRVRGTAAPGALEVFNDTGSQGANFLGTVAGNGAWQADVDVSELLNVTATVTDPVGNTSQFGAFGITTGGDLDGDGFADPLEVLAGTDPADPGDAPTLGDSIDVLKAQVKLNFAKADKDGLSLTTTAAPFVPGGAVIGIYLAGHTERFTLDAKGKGASERGKIAVKQSKSLGLTVKYAFKNADLGSLVAPFGLTDHTTAKVGERWVLPVVVTVGKTMYTATVTLTYKATQGKSGKAKK